MSLNKLAVFLKCIPHGMFRASFVMKGAREPGGRKARGRGMMWDERFLLSMRFHAFRVGWSHFA